MKESIFTNIVIQTLTYFSKLLKILKAISPLTLIYMFVQWDVVEGLDFSKCLYRKKVDAHLWLHLIWLYLKPEKQVLVENRA